MTGIGSSSGGCSANGWMCNAIGIRTVLASFEVDGIECTVDLMNLGVEFPVINL